LLLSHRAAVSNPGELADTFGKLKDLLGRQASKPAELLEMLNHRFRASILPDNHAPASFFQDQPGKLWVIDL
jgi:hypothetical protein